MNPLADDLIVALLLALSLGYAVIKLGPRSLRRRIQAAVAGALSTAPAAFGLSGLAQRLRARTLQGSAGTCGGCDNCAADAAAPAMQPDQAGEVAVPVAKIGRRVAGPAKR